MKTIQLLLVLWLLPTGVLVAQKNFEGVIKFNIEIEGDLQGMESMMPSSYDFYFRKGDVVFKMEGGLMGSMIGDILLKGATGKSYMIKHGEQIVYNMSDEMPQPETDKEDPAPEKLDEYQTILGYKCQKYKVAVDGPGGPSVSYMWVTDKIKVQRPKGAPSTMAGGAVLSGKVDGFPLKVEAEAMGLKTVMTAKEVVSEKLDKTQFEVPEDYTQKTFDPSMFGF